MSCGNCNVCSCTNKFEHETLKFDKFQNLLGVILEKFDYNVIYQPVQKLDKDDFFTVFYNVEDDLFEVRPHYEFQDYSQVVELMKHKSTGNIYDEHGKLLASFQLHIKNNEWNDEFNFEYERLNNKSSELFSGPESSISSNIKDYKLKRLISRYISIIENEGVTKPKKHEYGSSELEHLLWMLHNIYPKKSRSMLERYMFLGYIQGVLRSKNKIDVRHERDIMHELV